MKHIRLALRPETIKHLTLPRPAPRVLPRKQLAKAKGGVRTVFESLFLCDTAAGPCHTDWASCDSDAGCSDNMMCL